LGSLDETAGLAIVTRKRSLAAETQISSGSLETEMFSFSSIISHRPRLMATLCAVRIF